MANIYRHQSLAVSASRKLDGFSWQTLFYFFHKCFSVLLRIEDNQHSIDLSVEPFSCFSNITTKQVVKVSASTLTIVSSTYQSMLLHAKTEWYRLANILYYLCFVVQ